MKITTKPLESFAVSLFSNFTDIKTLNDFYGKRHFQKFPVTKNVISTKNYGYNNINRIHSVYMVF